MLRQPGVTTVVIDLGQVDLRQNNCGDATEVEASLQDMVAQAYAAGIRVILGTIAPASYCTNASSPNYGPNPINNGGPFAGDINPGPENPDNVQRHLERLTEPLVNHAGPMRSAWPRSFFPTICGRRSSR